MALGRDPSQYLLRDVIPEELLLSESLASLEARFVSRDNAPPPAIWFEDLTPAELEVVFPTTDAKINYLSRTQRLASLLACSGDIKISAPLTSSQSSREQCVHADLLAKKRERFAAVINRFLDLHQILRG
ncbi:DNA packaging protein [pteropodid alphaherpesvirus 2]|uniref:DNA packaging protein n=1 Tax=pteropodid alphaherpesvirus 2 TaxID=3118716 RepID=A0A510J710_9ALPH|nr:DNA packaging protein [pteropodid alphaherpesvirus 2]BBM13205.1 DNA packaging protein [pteropodid alphaherpesvirus 2]